MHNLLSDPIFRIQTDTEETSLGSLPEVFAGLCKGEIRGFASLRRYQHHSWYAFLVQVGALALMGNEGPPPSSAEQWSKLLRQLGGAYPGDAAWSLVEADLSLPAFLQPPVPEGKLVSFKKRYSCPDEIDLLITSKNHDVKRANIVEATLDQWVFALVSLQTMQGYSGAGNYGIARMNGAHASRPCVGFTPSKDWSQRFQRDLSVLRAKRQEVLKMHPHFLSEKGIGLVWLEPWDGTKSLGLNELDPYFVEICRRVRMGFEEQRLVIYVGTSKVARIQAKEIFGNTGDPWTPVEKKAAKSLTVAAKGFSFDVLSQLLFSNDYEPGICQKIHSRIDEPSGFVIAQAIVRGQCVTEGYQERILPIPGKVGQRLLLEGGLDVLSEMSRDRIKDVERAWRSCLRVALMHLLQGVGKSGSLNRKDSRPDRWRKQFHDQVEQEFFPQLWQALPGDGGDPPEEECGHAWKEWLAALSRKILTQAIEEVPLSSLRRYRHISSAVGYLEGSLRKNLTPPAKQKEGKRIE